MTEKIALEFQKQLDAAQSEKQKLEKTRKAAFQAIADVTKSAKQELDGECIQILQKQKVIDDQIKRINQNQLQLQRQVQQWTELIQKFNSALKALGDAGKTAAVITEDLQALCTKAGL